MVKDIREYENMHVALWLLKDVCWVLTWKIPAMIMIVPTVLIAIHITWRSRKDIADVLHNLAVTFWICANGTWMTGEFFCDDCTRPIAVGFFTCGMIVVTYYYLFLWPKRRKSVNQASSESSG